MKIRWHRVMLGLLVAVIAPLRADASNVKPDAEFAFAAPVEDSRELSNLIAGGLLQFGLTPGPITNVRSNGFFRISYTIPGGPEIMVRGPLSCVEVHIYTSRRSTDKNESVLQAMQIQEALIAHLRASTDGDVLIFKAVQVEPYTPLYEPCTYAL
jgi:hypothetical protein